MPATRASWLRLLPLASISLRPATRPRLREHLARPKGADAGSSGGNRGLPLPARVWRVLGTLSPTEPEPPEAVPAARTPLSANCPTHSVIRVVCAIRKLNLVGDAAHMHHLHQYPELLSQLV